MKHVLKKESAFTLIELILVLSLISIVAITAVPALLDIQAVTLDGASRKVESDLRYAQNLSMTTGSDTGFRTTTAGGGSTYEIYDVDSDTAIESPYDHLPMQEDFNSESEGYPGITFSGDDTIIFNSQGNATFVSGDGVVTMQNMEEASTNVNVTATGLITIE